VIGAGLVPDWLVIGPEVAPPVARRQAALYVRTTVADGPATTAAEKILERLRVAAEERGLAVGEAYVDRKAGKTFPSLRRLVAAVEDGEVEAVVATREEQIFPTAFHLATFAGKLLARGVRVVLVDTGFDSDDAVGRSQFALAVEWIDRVYRQRASVAGRISQALYPAQPTPVKAMINPAEVRDLYHAGHSRFSLQRELAARGCRASAYSIDRVLTSLRQAGELDPDRHAKGRAALVAAGKRFQASTKWPPLSDAELAEIVARNETALEAADRLAAAGKEISPTVIDCRLRRAWKAGRIPPRPLEYLLSRGVISGRRGGWGRRKSCGVGARWRSGSTGGGRRGPGRSPRGSARSADWPLGRGWPEERFPQGFQPQRLIRTILSTCKCRKQRTSPNHAVIRGSQTANVGHSDPPHPGRHPLTTGTFCPTKRRPWATGGLRKTPHPHQEQAESGPTRARCRALTSHSVLPRREGRSGGPETVDSGLNAGRASAGNPCQTRRQRNQGPTATQKTPPA